MICGRTPIEQTEFVHRKKPEICNLWSAQQPGLAQFGPQRGNIIAGVVEVRLGLLGKINVAGVDGPQSLDLGGGLLD